MAKRAVGRGAARGGARFPRGRSLVGLLLLGFVLVATGVIWRRSYGIARARELDALQRRRAALEARKATLEGEIRELSSRARLAPIAEQRLGMHIPSDSQVVILPKPSSAAAPDAPPSH
jgi:cell division protein FtsL